MTLRRILAVLSSLLLLLDWSGYRFAASAFSVASASSSTNPILNTKLPMVDLHYGFPPQLVNVAQYAANKNMLILFLPGAFTPTCSNVQIPGYLEHQNEVRDAGIDEIMIVSVNDGAVMAAWFQDQQLQGETMFQMMGDPTGDFTRACGLELLDPRPIQKGLIGRSQRAAMIVVQNVIRYIAVSAAPDDPAGDLDPSSTCHEAIIRVCRDELQLPTQRKAKGIVATP